MKLFLVCSKHNYKHVPEIKGKLEGMGHEVIVPNSFDDPFREESYKKVGEQEHADWKAEMIRAQEDKVRNCDALLVLNFNKNGIENYIGGSTFLEVYSAWSLGKKIYFYNPLPDLIFTDELKAFKPEVIHGNLQLLTEI